MLPPRNQLSARIMERCSSTLRKDNRRKVRKKGGGKNEDQHVLRCGTSWSRTGRKDEV